MRSLIFTVIAMLLSIMSVKSQDLQVIKLNKPDMTRGTTLMKVLSDRHSTREFSNKELSLQDISDLLWAANGVNRKDGKRTAPSAMNRQEIDVYLINKDGAYIYDPTTHELKPVSTGDYRDAVASGQDFVSTAPVCIVLVANLDKLGDPLKESTKLIAAMDGGIVNQNINLFCSAIGLVTVPRATMNKTELVKALKLTDNQMLILNNPIGYPKN